MKTFLILLLILLCSVPLFSGEALFIYDDNGKVLAREFVTSTGQYESVDIVKKKLSLPKDAKSIIAKYDSTLQINRILDRDGVVTFEYKPKETFSGYSSKQLLESALLLQYLDGSLKIDRFEFGVIHMLLDYWNDLSFKDLKVYLLNLLNTNKIDKKTYDLVIEILYKYGVELTED